jgi:hypothetical protein
MTTDTPIACSLSADELPARLAEVRAVGKDALLAVTPEGSLHFRADDTTRERLEAIIAAESQCCSFLRFELAEESGALVLSVAAPEGAEPLAQDLVDAFAADRSAA